VAATLLLTHRGGKTRTVRPGFSWFAFLLPMLWAISEGLWRPFGFALLGGAFTKFSIDAYRSSGAALVAIVGLLGYAVLMFLFGWFGKKWLVADLLKHGYVEQSLPVAEPTTNRLAESGPG
jgi:hypothetical protein